MVKIIETEQNDGCQEPEEGGNGESDEYRVSVWEDKKSPWDRWW